MYLGANWDDGLRYRRDLLDIGVIPLYDMLPETALVKVMWVLANSTSLEVAKSLMQKNIAHEISPVSPII